MEWTLEQAKVINGCGYRKEIIIWKQSVGFYVDTENNGNILAVGGGQKPTYCPIKSS